MCSRLKRELSSELVESSSSSCLGNTVALVTFLVATKFSVVTLAAALAAGFFSSNENVEEGLTISSLVGDFDFFFFENKRNILPPERPLALESSFPAAAASSKSMGLSQVV